MIPTQPHDTTATCPTECDDDCDADCHECHYVSWKRDHEPNTCPGATESGFARGRDPDE